MLAFTGCEPADSVLGDFSRHRTATPTPAFSFTPVSTFTQIPTKTPTPTSTKTPTASFTSTPTSTSTPTFTFTSTATPTPTASPIPTTPMEADLVARYLFAGNAVDSGPSGLHGTVYGALPATDRHGNPGNAFYFDGMDDYVEIADNDVFSVSTTGSLTISVWMAPAVTTFEKEEGSGYVHWLGKGFTNNQEWNFRIYGLDNTEGRQNRTSFYVFNLTGGLGSGSYVQEPVTTGQWIHFAAVIDQEKTYIYKNGILKDSDVYYSDPYWIVPANGSSPVRIGSRDFNSFFKGAIDDITVFNRALTPSEIVLLYNLP
jgi:hypothetical protein